MTPKDNKPNHSWKIEISNPDIADQIREKLREVKDPELGMDIIQLGLMREVEEKDESIQLTMILTTPYCPYAPMLMESARKKVEEVIGKSTEIKYGSEQWDRSMMEEGSGFDWGLF